MTAPTAIDGRRNATRVAWTVWAVLVAVTVTGAVVTETDGPGDVLIALIVLLGLVKSWLIVRYYMEVRHSPRWLRIVTAGWMLGLWATLLVLFLRA